MIKHALILLADGFEELEFVAPFDILSRGGVSVVTASIHETTTVESARRLQVTADMLIDDVRAEEFDLLVLPGGGVGTQNLRKSEAVLSLVRDFYKQKKAIGAICAAPTVLAAAGILQEHRATCYPGDEGDVAPYCKTYVHERVVVDGQVVTSRSAGTAADFAFALLALLEGDARAKQISEQMHF
jgi:DJ-1 family protein